MTESLFLTALRARGASYVAARDALLARRDEARIWADRAPRARHPRVRLLASIVSMRLDRPAIFDEVVRRMRAEDAVQPDRVSPRARGLALAVLGPDAVVPILELLVFVQERRRTKERAGLDYALMLLRDARAVPHLEERMRPGNPERDRVAAAQTLARLRVPEGLPLFARLVHDDATPPDLRAAAARGLILLGTPEAARALLAAGEDTGAAEATRAAALGALLSLYQPPMLPRFVDFARNAPPAVAMAALGVLAERGDATARAALESLLDVPYELPDRDAVGATIARINARTDLGRA